ncbi:hypothetical protein ACLMJK_008441 [Lecanora helva]
MADLMSSLVVPSPRSSQDSFRSFPSQPDHSSPSPSTSNPQSASPTSSTFQAPALQAAGLPISDVNTYLAQHSHLRSTPNAANSKGVSKPPTSAAAESLEPVSLGKKTNFYVAALQTQCQSKGFVPVYEIEGQADKADFGGVLKLRDVTVSSDERWPSKKETKERLAEKGLKAVQGIEAVMKEPVKGQDVGKNWTVLLLEYHNLSTPNLGPTYHDYALGSAYACTCTIPSLPERPFGSLTDAFPSKKAARGNAAKEAVEYLIESGELNEDGSTKGRKKAKLGTAVRVQGRGLVVQKDTTYAQKVNDICPLLGLTAPTYIIRPESALAPNMLSGFATFQNAPQLPDEIGEIRNVFGKKKAKEEIARSVWHALEALAAERNVQIREQSGDDGSSE